MADARRPVAAWTFQEEAKSLRISLRSLQNIVSEHNIPVLSYKKIARLTQVSHTKLMEALSWQTESPPQREPPNRNDATPHLGCTSSPDQEVAPSISGGPLADGTFSRALALTTRRSRKKPVSRASSNSNVMPFTGPSRK